MSSSGQRHKPLVALMSGCISNSREAPPHRWQGKKPLAPSPSRQASQRLDRFHTVTTVPLISFDHRSYLLSMSSKPNAKCGSTLDGCEWHDSSFPWVDARPLGIQLYDLIDTVRTEIATCQMNKVKFMRSCVSKHAKWWDDRMCKISLKKTKPSCHVVFEAPLRLFFSTLVPVGKWGHLMSAPLWVLWERHLKNMRSRNT
jgi:hypothetical protein